MMKNYKSSFPECIHHKTSTNLVLPVNFIAKYEQNFIAQSSELANTVGSTAREASVEWSPAHVEYFLLSHLGSNSTSILCALYNIRYFYKFTKGIKNFGAFQFIADL